MIELGAKLPIVRPPKKQGAHIYRVSTDQSRPEVLAKNECYLARDGKMNSCFAVGLYQGYEGEYPDSDQGLFVLPDRIGYIADGDIIRLDQNGELRVLFRGSVPMNYFLVTERCNNSCLMCSQPPKNVVDDHLADEIEAVIRLLPVTTQAIGFTGGEPTLLGERFLNLVQSAASYLPHTDLHILSNGRRFKDATFTKRLRAVGHPRVSVGVPIYGVVPADHDFIVQAKGAFNETLSGLYALEEAGIKTELRIVIHKQTAFYLPIISDFIFRNLTFVDHVAFMGLERAGFAKANDGLLWVDPAEYRVPLTAAVQRLVDYGMTVSVYNLPHCLLDKSIWGYAKQSISDWKNEYLPQCFMCDAKNDCCGFFSTDGLRQSKNIIPIQH